MGAVSFPLFKQSFDEPSPEPAQMAINEDHQQRARENLHRSALAAVSPRSTSHTPEIQSICNNYADILDEESTLWKRKGKGKLWDAQLAWGERGSRTLDCLCASRLLCDTDEIRVSELRCKGWRLGSLPKVPVK